jgi:hypothetical protein
MVSQTINNLVNNDQTNGWNDRVMFTGEQDILVHLDYTAMADGGN